MSLSRPARFPLLKLPWLCIKCVIQNSDLFDIIYFATISNRTLRIVQHSKYPLKKIDVDSSRSIISMGRGKHWNFSRYAHEFGVSLLQKRNSEPFSISRSYNFITGHNLHSYTINLKMGIEFMIEVFGCKIGNLIIAGDKISDVFGLGINSVEELFINDPGPVNITDLKCILENIKVTDTYGFYAPIPANFSCDPRIFKCRKLVFGWRYLAAWVTFDILCQFDVPQLAFWSHRFSNQDVVSYINYWFYSENRKLEYLNIHFKNPISLEDFKIDHLNPMPFCEKRRSRWSLHEKWEKTDMSKGKDILRQDGLLATLHAYPTSVIFYVWHKRFPDAA